MSSYSIIVGETRHLVDQNGASVASAGTVIGDHDAGLLAVVAAGDGTITATGVLPGTSGLRLTQGGAAVLHQVTILPKPFDWSVGDPV